MLRYKTETRPGLVALYDIRPENGAGQFLQPRIPHGALLRKSFKTPECTLPMHRFGGVQSSLFQHQKQHKHI